MSLYLQLTDKKKKFYSRRSDKIATTYTEQITEQILYLSLILQYSQNWLVPNEPQKHEKHETDRILTQKCVKKKYRKEKCNLISQNTTKTLQSNCYKLIKQKG